MSSRGRLVNVCAGVTLSLQLALMAIGTGAICFVAGCTHEEVQGPGVTCQCLSHTLPVLSTGNAVVPEAVSVHTQAPAAFTVIAITTAPFDLWTAPLSPPPRPYDS